MSNFIETVADARVEKNMEDVIADHLAQKEKKRNQELIDFFKSKIEKEKELICDCLEQNYFDFAEAAINRIKEMKSFINDIESTLQ
jgi:hypothetical protein